MIQFIYQDSKLKGENKMKRILVLLGSPRQKGNTALMAEAFIKGAREAGNSVTAYSIGKREIRPCKACDYCQKHGGECVQKEDMRELYELLQSHDTLVMASPVYYLGMPGNLKNVIDRTYAESAKGRKIKYAALLTAACKKESEVTEVLNDYYRRLTAYLGWEDKGMVNALGVENPGEIENTCWLKEAYELGKNI